MVNLTADSWTKYWNFNLKAENAHVPKKLFIVFAEIWPAIFFERSLGPRPTFPFPGCVFGNIFWENSSGSPYFAPRDGPPVHKV
jgi:hypothetical protein